MTNSMLILAGVAKDAIIERLENYTPVKDGHQACILAYTLKQYNALRDVIVAEKLNLDIEILKTWIDAMIEDAHAKGYKIIAV